MPDEKSVPPFDLVVNLKDSGFSKDQIVDNLARQGYSMQAIDDVFTQLDIKSAADVPVPQQQGMQRSSLSQESMIPRLPSSLPSQTVSLSSGSSSNSVSSDQIQELVESIVQEKWQRVAESFGDLVGWKDRVRTEIVAIKQELLRLETRFDGLQQAVMGKIQDYDKGISDVGVEIKALEKVLERIIQPLSQNVKELGRITEDLKKR
ncbi:MAG TPA: hypothetical protein VJB87_01905 [Candidatus Nanoarchaeia archaeon]|nr:hypothetical protein [Candidatus Nanoarchaeia archaeon]